MFIGLCSHDSMSMSMSMCFFTSEIMGSEKWKGTSHCTELDQTQEVTGNVERGDESMSEVTKPLTKF